MTRRQHKPYSRFAVGFVLTLCAILATTTRAEEFSRTTFEKEAMQGWSAWMKQSSYLKLTGTCTHRAKAPNFSSEKTVLVDFRQRGSFVCERRTTDGNTPADQTAVVVGRNALYGFAVTRSSTKGPWVLSRMESDPHAMDEILFEGMIEFVEAPWVIVGKPLPVMCAEMKFNLKSIVSNDARMVTIDFDYTPERAANDTAIRGGTIVFDSKRNWAVCEYNLRTPTPGAKLIGKITYSDDPAGSHRTSKVETRFVSADGLSESGQLFVFETYEPKTIPAAEFGLSTFGLPEPASASGGKPREIDPSIKVAESSRSVGKVLAGSEHDIVFSLENNSSRPVTIVGAADSCDPDGCTLTKGLPLKIEPGKAAEVHIAFSLGSAGKVDRTHWLFTDNSLKGVRLRITGTVVSE